MKLQFILAALFSLLLSWTAVADVKTISMELDATQLQQLKLQVDVGQIKINTADTDTIQLQVDVSGEKRWWFFSHKVGDVELLQQRQDRQLTLRIDKENTKQDWQLIIPQQLGIFIELGVGQLFAEQLTADVYADIGVGQVTAELDANQYHQILLSAGVGNVQLKNAPTEGKSERHLVGGSLKMNGSGQATFEASVGVGDISMTHK